MSPARQLQKGRPPGTLHALLDYARSFAGVAWLTGGLLAVVATTAVCLLNLPKPWAVATLAAFGASLLLPLRVPPPAWARRFCAFSIAELRRYFPITWVLAPGWSRHVESPAHALAAALRWRDSMRRPLARPRLKPPANFAVLPVAPSQLPPHSIVYEDKDAVSGDGPFVIGACSSWAAGGCTDGGRSAAPAHPPAGPLARPARRTQPCPPPCAPHTRPACPPSPLRSSPRGIRGLSL